MFNVSINVRKFVFSVNKYSSKTAASILGQLEEIVPEEVYPQVRKVVLDAINSFKRSLVARIFDIEVEKNVENDGHRT